MSTIEIITLSNTVLTTITLTLTYFNYHHSRKKDFQDKLFQIKLDAYKELNAKCYDAYLTLNINSEPFNEIYKIDTKDEWDRYFDKEFMGLYKVGFQLQETIYGYAYLLPNDVITKYYDFSNFCLGFVTYGTIPRIIWRRQRPQHFTNGQPWYCCLSDPAGSCPDRRSPVVWRA